LIGQRPKAGIASRSPGAQALANGLARYLAQLGLERRTKQKNLLDVFSRDEPERTVTEAGQQSDSQDRDNGEEK